MTKDFTDWDMSDRREMERSALAEFVDESQLDVLIQLWNHGERADNLAYIRYMEGKVDDE
jgi:hypothetical protein